LSAALRPQPISQLVTGLKEIQQIQINGDELLNQLSNYVDFGVTVCSRHNAERSAEQDAHISGIITPRDPGKDNSVDVDEIFKNLNRYTKSNVVVSNDWSRQFDVLSEADCEVIKRVSDTVRGNTIRTTAERTQFREVVVETVQMSAYPIKLIHSEIASLDEYLHREEELETNLASLNYLSLVKIISPILLGLGVGVRLARTHFDVKTEQEKQKPKATADIPSPAIATTNDGGSTSSESAAINPPIDATTVGEAQD
jgi:hypothetical protein